MQARQQTKRRGSRSGAPSRPRRVIWTPQPKQLQYMRRFEDEALYGGAAGGGKTDCAIAEALRQVNIPHYRGIILRKTYPQLSDVIDRSHEIYRAAYPEARYNDQKHCWTFPSGAKIYFGSMQHVRDRTNYQGKHYEYIDFDELTHFTWDEYSYLFSRNRPNGPGTRCYCRGQANPGGIGHGWVKNRFISAAPAMQTIWEQVKIRWPDGHEETRWKSRVFVPASVFDNKILLQNDPDYLTRLASMPEQERKALLYGNWDVFAGQVFTEWRNDPDHYDDRINTHVIAPFRVPQTWRIIRSLDWGYSRPFSVGWYAVDHDGRMYRIRELYGSTGTPNEGVRWTVSQLAQEIKRIEGEDENLSGRYIYGIADPAIFQRDGGESIGETMIREGVYFDRGDHSRIAGKQQIHNRLQFDANGIPMLYVFATCRNCIRTLPELVYSETDVEDVDTSQEDHIYDELRYAAMLNPINPPPRETPRLEIIEPLETDAEREARLHRYDFYSVY